MELHELIYVSVATREMSHADLTALLDQSREKNARLKITGLLVYYRGEFAQMLEGSKSDVFSMYETICRDARNHQNRLLWNGRIEQRALADWSMAFLAPSESALKGKPGYSTFLEAGFGVQDRSLPPSWAKTFMLTLRDDFLEKR